MEHNRIALTRRTYCNITESDIDAEEDETNTVRYGDEDTTKPSADCIEIE
jgi:hypothetical protein